MKKFISFTIVMILIMSASVAFASNENVKKDAETATAPVTETKLTEEELNTMRERIEEIRDMDKSEMKSKERKELRNEVKEIKKDIKKGGGTIYIGGASLLIIILILIILL